MNERELDDLLEQMKGKPLPSQDGMTDEELLISFRRRRHSRNAGGARKAAVLVLLLASLGYCFHAYSTWQAKKASAEAKMNEIFKQEGMQHAQNARAEQAPVAMKSHDENDFKKKDAANTTISSPNGKWRFLPCFGKDVRGVEAASNGDAHFHDSLPEPVQKLLSPESDLTEAQRNELHWHTATFPHTDFVKIMPQRNSFGWYGCEFDMPPTLNGMDVIADMGIIDDADETFVNGSRIGATGRVPNGSAWQTDRRYRVPAQTLTPFRNYLAVHVWNLWGSGGIAGPPVLKAAILPPNAKWEASFFDAKAVPADGLNSAESLEAALSLFHAAGNKAPFPMDTIDEWKGDSHYALFRTSFTLMDGDAPRRFDTPVILDMGTVFDVAAVFLNGQRIGLVGRFPQGDSPAFTEAAQRVRLAVPPEAWSKDGRNELAAVVHRERGRGGIAGSPGILLEDPLEFEAPTFAQLSDSYYILLQSGDKKAAERLLDRMRPKGDDEKAWLLSHRAHISFLKWLDGGMKDATLLEGTITPIAEILETLPEQSPKQSAMQAFCRVLRLAERDESIMEVVKRRIPSFRKKITYIGADSVTKGDWPLQYGVDNYVLSAMGQLMDIHSPLAKYGIRLPLEGKLPYLYLDVNLRDTAMPEALLKPIGTYDAFGKMERIDFMSTGQSFATGQKIRSGSWWDDTGEKHPFDDNGPDLLIDWSVSTMRQRIAMYFLDYDWRNTLHPRQQSVIAFDSDGKFQDAAWLGIICEGNYHLFETTSEKNTFRVNKHRSTSACISGVFSDNSEFSAPPEGLPPHVAALAARILEIERRHASHSEFDTLRNDFHSISSLDDAKALAAALNWSGIRTPRWRMMLFARVFELLDGMEGAELREAVRTTIGSIYPRMPVNAVLDVVLLNYLLKRGVPSDAPICNELKHRLPKWNKITITIP